MGLRLVVLRHGSTQWNRERRYQGCVDTPLSEDGQAQAEAAAVALADRQLAAVYASPLARSRETAGVIAARHRLSVLEAPAFKEICLGVWEGHTVSEVRARFPELYAAWRDHPHTLTLPEGESLAQVRERVVEGLDGLRSAHDGETVCLVSHGVAIRLLILEALGLSPERLWSIRVDAAGISELEYRDGWATVHRMNLVSHLDGVAGGRRP
ncbi:MAG: histidine phosphatase family protein [Candidatus Rokubacteria bacterium]|nr:histidine phosphatase family protein [Candidatus Rokubacteria bacterium]